MFANQGSRLDGLQHAGKEVESGVGTACKSERRQVLSDEQRGSSHNLRGR